jgi:hypothetical protein
MRASIPVAGANARDVAAAKALVQALAGSMAAPVLKSKGMDASP